MVSSLAKPLANDSCGVFVSAPSVDLMAAAGEYENAQILFRDDDSDWSAVRVAFSNLV